jgi:hypothetical protein
MAESNNDDMFKKMSEARDRYQAKAMSIPGVFGTSIGIRQVAGKLVAEPAIIFHVEKKSLLREIPVDERIPKELEGFPTDVVAEDLPATDGAARTQAAKVDEEKYRPLKGGCQIAAQGPDGTNIGGTLGCAVKYIGESRHELYKGQICVLSNQHVMLGEGNPIFQPTNSRGDRIGSVRVSDNEVDAAIADFGWYNDGVEPEILDIGPVTGTYDVTWSDIQRGAGYEVKKRGRATGHTTGKIYSALFKASTPGTTGFDIKRYCIAQFNEGKVVPGFAASGDSGSVVLNNKNQVVGLLTALIGQADGTERGDLYATPIKDVLAKLQIEIWTG